MESSKPTVHRQNRWQYLQIDATIGAGEKGPNNSTFSSPKGLRTGFGKDVLTKKETVFRLSLWWARRDLNLRHEARPPEDFLGVSENEPSPFRPRTDVGTWAGVGHYFEKDALTCIVIVFVL